VKAGDKFAVGFGLDITQTRLELKQHADLYYVADHRHALTPSARFRVASRRAPTSPTSS